MSKEKNKDINRVKLRDKLRLLGSCVFCIVMVILYFGVIGSIGDVATMMISVVENSNPLLFEGIFSIIGLFVLMIILGVLLNEK